MDDSIVIGEFPVDREKVITRKMVVQEMAKLAEALSAL